MSDDTGKPRTLEIHINLNHPDLLDREGKVSTRRLAGLLGVLPDVIGEAVTSEANGVIASVTAEPMGYWLFTYKDTPTATEED